MIEEKKRGAGDPFPGIRDVFSTTLETVTGEYARLAKGTVLAGTPLQDAVTEVATSAVRGVVAMGSDLIPGAKGIIMGIVQATRATDEAALRIVSHASQIIIHLTADRGGNLAAASKGVVLGAIASAKSMGVETARAASAAAQGALEGAREAGSVTVERVRGALKEPIGGSQVVLPAPLRM